MRDNEGRGHQDEAVMEEHDPTSINRDLMLQGLAPDDDDDLAGDAEAFFGSSAALINVDGDAAREEQINKLLDGIDYELEDESLPVAR
ncbi:hypothetical protein E2562_006771 [Oryza meyeriana var. granulata]|uniref:Uncharacterized protein n=1 Tax=Oryza meyeriana var. granulata TaxID=110450 RepID=A0A6G1C4H9_9ORYZ|nr:hypothetical protein E2562_006771 [Oryza meyeriana var. granulata]